MSELTTDFVGDYCYVRGLDQTCLIRSAAIIENDLVLHVQSADGEIHRKRTHLINFKKCSKDNCIFFPIGKCKECGCEICKKHIDEDGLCNDCALEKIRSKIRKREQENKERRKSL